jgi:hypothetical protein
LVQGVDFASTEPSRKRGREEVSPPPSAKHEEVLPPPPAEPEELPPKFYPNAPLIKANKLTEKNLAKSKPRPRSPRAVRPPPSG